MRGGQLKCGCDPQQNCEATTVLAGLQLEKRISRAYKTSNVKCWDEYLRGRKTKVENFNEELGGNAAISWRVVRLPKLLFRRWWHWKIGPTPNWSAAQRSRLNLTSGVERHLQLPTYRCANLGEPGGPSHHEDKLHWQISDRQAGCHVKRPAETGPRQPLACAGHLQQAMLLELRPYS